MCNACVRPPQRPESPDGRHRTCHPSMHAPVYVAGPQGVPIIYTPGNSAARHTGSWRVFRPIIDLDACTLCGICFAYCPDGAITLDAHGYPERRVRAVNRRRPIALRVFREIDDIGSVGRKGEEPRGKKTQKTLEKARFPVSSRPSCSRLPSGEDRTPIELLCSRFRQGCLDDDVSRLLSGITR